LPESQLSGTCSANASECFECSIAINGAYSSRIRRHSSSDSPANRLASSAIIATIASPAIFACAGFDMIRGCDEYIPAEVTSGDDWLSCVQLACNCHRATDLPPIRRQELKNDSRLIDASPCYYWVYGGGVDRKTKLAR
jgi:hypothetical protein